MKRIFISLLLALSLTLCLVGCGETENDDGSQAVSDTSETTSPDASEDTSSQASQEDEYLFGKPTASSSDLSKKDYTAVSAIPENELYTPSASIDGYKYIDATYTDVFEITGILHPDDNCDLYMRLDFENMHKYSATNNQHAKSLSGARLRFVTDAEKIVLYAQMGAVFKMNHFSAKGAYGFDVYTGTGTDRQYIGAPGNHLTDEKLVHSEVELGKGYKEVTIVFPIYGGISSLYIGLPDNAKIALPDSYSIEKPICFYGSSITQGGCVSRPGLTYASLLSFALDAPIYNLGFSGSALGEQAVADFIGKLDISAFVMDYDYNAPDVKHLTDTHYSFYKTVRQAHPDIPIIILPHPYYTDASASDRARVDVVRQTYEKAISEGDTNVYFLDSDTYFPADYRDITTVDNSHPTDIGHLFMAKAIYPLLYDVMYK